MDEPKQPKPENYPAIRTTAPPEDTIAAQSLEEKTSQRSESGTFMPGGYITDEDYNSVWDTRKRFDIIEEMRRGDSTVKASLQAITLPIRAAEWDILPLSDSKKDVEIAAFCKHNLMERMSFDDFLRQALLMLPFGFSVFEKVFEVIDWNGKEYVGLKKLQFMKQWSVLKWQTPAGNLGVTQMLRSGPSNIPIPWWKLVVFTNDREGDNYQGISILRPAYKHWDIKNKLYIIDALANEKQGLGVPQLKTPAGASQEDREAARSVARNMRANKEAFNEMPEGFELEYLDMKANNTKNPWISIAHHNREILLNVLAQFFDLGSGGAGGRSGGSNALSTDQSRMFQMSLEAVAKNVAQTVYSMVLQDLVTLNYPGSPIPPLTFGKLSDDNVLEIATYVGTLMTAGAIHSDPDLEEWLRKLIKSPDLPDILRKRIEENMHTVDLTPNAVDNVNKGDNPSLPDASVEEVASGKDGETTQNDKTDANPPKDKQPVQAADTIEDVRQFRDYLDKRIAAMESTHEPTN